jgi:predicted DNA-binding transcriptional regulator YafY
MDQKNRFSKTSRMLSLFERLNQGELIDKAREASNFGVNEKTLQRDLDDLRSYLVEKYPEEASTGIFYDHKRKGYFLYRDQQNWLSSQEILALAKVLLESRAFSKGEMSQLLDKLVMQSTPTERRHIQEVIQNERYHYVELQHQRPMFKTLWELSRAVREQYLVEIDYSRVGDGQLLHRVVEPQGLIFSEFYFYLVAYIRDSDYDFPAIYRLDRIKDYRASNEHFYVPYEKRFEEGELRKRIQFMQSGHLMTIRFRFWGESLEAVLDRLPTARVLENDGRTAVIEAEVFGRGIKMWLLSQMQYLEVLKPEDFRTEIINSIKQMTSIYEGK